MAEQASSEIGGETAVFGGDLTKEGVPDQLVQKAIDEFGQLGFYLPSERRAIGARLRLAR